MPLQPLASPGALMWPPKPASLSSPGGGGAGRERHQAWQPQTAHLFLYILYICMYLYMIFYYKYRAQMGPGSGGGVSCWSVPTQEQGWEGTHRGELAFLHQPHVTHCHPCPCAWRPAQCGGEACPWACAVKGVHPEVLPLGRCRGAHLWVLITPAQPLQPSPPAQGLGGFGGA